jgi:hypothetical protein
MASHLLLLAIFSAFVVVLYGLKRIGELKNGITLRCCHSWYQQTIFGG